MELVHTRHWRSTPLQGPARGARIRPGERPSWIELPIGRRWWPVWRRAASEHNVSVDAWVAACLELHTVFAAADASQSARNTLQRAVLADRRRSYMPPTDELRDWSIRLAGRGPTPPHDELPTVVLPQRVLNYWLPALALPDLTVEDGRLAVMCERAAALRGMTLEAWALRALLESRSATRT